MATPETYKERIFSNSPYLQVLGLFPIPISPGYFENFLIQQPTVLLIEHIENYQLYNYH